MFILFKKLFSLKKKKVDISTLDFQEVKKYLETYKVKEITPNLIGKIYKKVSKKIFL